MADSVAFENEMVLATVQALVGVISSDILAVTISSDSRDRSLDVFFAVGSIDDDLKELMDEVQLDISALTAGSVLVRTHLWQGSTWTSDWPGSGRRPVFAAAT